MLVLFTDFGLAGPYTGQMKAVLHHEAPGVPVVDLFADAPRFDPEAAAYLLAAYAPEMPADTVFVCVVDPGVGTERAALALQADGRWFVGPDNGLMAIAAKHARSAMWYRIVWRPERLSASFHGRDLFAPTAARLATGHDAGLEPVHNAMALVGADWPDDLDRIAYVDVYGNAMIGRRAVTLPAAATAVVGGTRIARRRTFAEAGPGAPLWYENANGLAEIAVNGGSAAERLGLGVGTRVAWT